MKVTEYRNGKRRWVSAPMQKARREAQSAAEALGHILEPWEYEERGCEVTRCVVCLLPLSIDLDSDEKMHGRPIMVECEGQESIW